jgi:hypothetical protein
VGNVGRWWASPSMQGAPATTRGVPDWREAGGGGSAGWCGGVGDPGLSVETEERWIFTGSGFEPPRAAQHVGRTYHKAERPWTEATTKSDGHHSRNHK